MLLGGIIDEDAVGVRTKRALSAILVALCLLAVCLTLFATSSRSTSSAFADSSADATSAIWASSSTDTSSLPTVKVGVAEFPDYCYRDSNGVWAGIDVEYIENIAQHAGFKVEFVVVNSAAEATANLDAGITDIQADMTKTDERTAKYLFSDKEAGATIIGLFVRQGDGRWDYGSIDQLSSITVGSLQSNVSGTMYSAYCASHGVTPHLVEFSSVDEMLAALDTGQVDGILESSDYLAGHQIILSFPATSYYLMFRQDDIALKNRVDTATQELLAQNPDYLQSLISKYQKVDSQSLAYALTQTEKTYIAEHPVVKVAVLDNDAPYFYRDSQGADKGVLPDYYQKLSSLIGLSFEFDVYNSQANAINAVKAGDADILGMYSDGLIYANREGLLLTRKYTTVSTALVARSGIGADNVKKIAVKERSKNNLRQTVASNVELVGYSTATACFEALKNGDVDGTICGLPSATWLINQNDSAAFSIFVRSADTLDLCGGVNLGNATLASIMDKAIYTSSADVDGIIASNTLAQSDWLSFVSRIPAAWLVGVFAVLILAILALIYGMRTLVLRQREKASVMAARSAADALAAEAAAEKAINDERTRFFSTVSHDMRTPLNGIMGFADLAGKTDDVAHKDDYIGKIKVSSAMLLSLVNDVLTISRMESGKQVLRPEPTALPAFIEDALVPVRENAAAKGVDLSFAAAGLPACTVMLDRLSMQKVLLNLLTNAIKFTPAGGHARLMMAGAIEPGLEDHGEANVDLAADSSAQAAPGRLHVTIVVSDDGIGMSEEFASRAFEPFAQENGAGAGNMGNGTGLGLAIVKQLVDAMGGTIDLKTEKAAGTTFTVSLSFVLASPEQAQQAQVEERASRSASVISLKGLRALLVEDNSMNAEIARTILEKQGVSVECADNGERGLAAFRASAPGYFQVVLMDVRMPVMDGCQATRAIRALPRSDAKTVPIVAMTADAYPEDVRRCLDAGMNAHVPKPFKPEDLYRTLGDCLSDAK